MKLLLFFLLLLATNTNPLVVPSEAATNRPLSVAAQIDSIVQQYRAQYEIPGLAVGVVQGDSFSYSQGYGYRRIETPAPVLASSVFHTASISKLFTAQAVLQLAATGQFELGDQIAVLLPELQARDDRFQQVTIRQLLNHTAGLPDIKNYRWRRQHESTESLERYLLAYKFRLDFTPGTAYQYSNLGYNLLGYLIQEFSGVTFADYVQEHILRPSGMPTSDFRYFRIPERLRVSPHSKRSLNGKIYSRSVYPYTREHAPSSTLNASAEELCAWMQTVLTDLQAGEQHLFHQMIQPSTPTNQKIGLGFQLFEVEGTPVAGHFGGDRGFRSYLLLVPEENLGLVLLANCDYEEDFRQDILHAILRLLVT